MPDKPREPEYDGDVEVRRVRPDGYALWRGGSLKLTPLLAAQPVAFKAIDQDEWELWYGPVLLGHVLLRDGKPRFDPLR